MYLGIATTEKRFELDDFLVLDTQQLLQLSKGAHRCNRGRSGDVRNGPLAGCSDHGHGAVCRQLWSVLLVGEPLLRRREAQRVKAHAHRHAGVADRHSALGTLVHSTRTKLPREENRSRDENHDPDSASSAASTPRFRALQQRRTNSRDELPRLRLSRSFPMCFALSLFLIPYPHSSTDSFPRCSVISFSLLPTLSIMLSHSIPLFPSNVTCHCYSLPRSTFRLCSLNRLSFFPCYLLAVVRALYSSSIDYLCCFFWHFLPFLVLSLFNAWLSLERCSSYAMYLHSTLFRSLLKCSVEDSKLGWLASLQHLHVSFSHLSFYAFPSLTLSRVSMVV